MVKDNKGRKQSRGMASKNKASRGKKYQQPNRCSVGRGPTVDGGEQPVVQNCTFTPIKPKFERKKGGKNSKEQVSAAVSKSSSVTKGKNSKQAAQQWVKLILDSGLRDLRKIFVETVKPYMPPGTKDAFSVEANMERNRYDDVELLDKTRVKLNNPPDGNDYIHASFVEVSPEMIVICAQGPLENTIEHFWIMVVEQSCKVILQLCQFMEDGKEKSTPYFPTAEQEAQYGSIKVRVVSRQMDVGAMKKMERTLLEVTLGTVILETTHLLFSGWPDHSVPESLSSYIDMRSLIRRLADKKPIVAHCSAGIGRSGTYTAIEMTCHDLLTKQDRNFSVISMMQRLRDQRTQAVQNDQQFVFIHRMMFEIMLTEKIIEKSPKLTQFIKEYEDLMDRKRVEIAKLKKRK